MDSKEKSISLPLVILFVLVAAAAFAALGYWEGKKTTETASEEAVPMPPVPVEPTESVTATASTTTDVTANWKTYSDTVNGFSFKYPSDWKIGPDIQVYKDVSTSGGQNTYSMIIEKESYSGTLSDFLSKLKSDDAANVAQGGPAHNFPVGENIAINGNSAIKLKNVTSVARVDDWYLVNKSGSVYTFKLMIKPGDGPLFDTSSYLATANQILSTFQFTK